MSERATFEEYVLALDRVGRAHSVDTSLRPGAVADLVIYALQAKEALSLERREKYEKVLAESVYLQNRIAVLERTIETLLQERDRAAQPAPKPPASVEPPAPLRDPTLPRPRARRRRP